MKILKIMFLMVIFCIFSEGALAYETFTHELITIRSSVNSSNYQKFKSDFGIDGKEELREGSVQEDDLATLRIFNHFFDPNDKRGLNIVGRQVGRSSREWGFNGGSGDTLSIVKDNDYSWSKAREHLYFGLTSVTQSERDDNLNLMFRSVGQVMHLVQDLAQPSHTRNDAHLSFAGLGDPSQLERWAGNNLNKVIGFFSSAGSPESLNSYETYFDKFAYFSNQNFFSDDTIFTDYPFPAIGETDYMNVVSNLLFQTVTAEDGKVDKVVYINKTGGEVTGYKVAQAIYFFREISTFSFTFSLQFQFDDKVADENAAILIPKAVEYSAGLLDYFFRGEMEVTPIKSNESSFAVTNLSDDEMSGDFELYYDKPDGNRAFIQTWKGTLPAGGSSVFENLLSPPDLSMDKEVELILVFRGQLGNEQDAVVAALLNVTPVLYLKFVLPDSTTIHWDIEKDVQVDLINETSVIAFNRTRNNMLYQNGRYYQTLDVTEVIGTYECNGSTLNLLELTHPVYWNGTDEGLVFIDYIDTPVGTASKESVGSAIRDESCGTTQPIYNGVITDTWLFDPAIHVGGPNNKYFVGAFDLGNPSTDANPKVIFGVSDRIGIIITRTYDRDTSYSIYFIADVIQERSLFAISAKNRAVQDKWQSGILTTLTMTEEGSLGSYDRSFTGKRIWLEAGLTTKKTFNENQITAVGYFRVNGPPVENGYISDDGDVVDFLVPLWVYDFDGTSFTYNSSKRLTGLENFLSPYAPDVPTFSGIVTGNNVR